MRTIVTVAVIIIVLVVFVLLRARQSVTPLAAQPITAGDLTAGEQKIDSLIKEVYGDAIVSQEFTREGRSAKVHLTFDTSKSKVKNLDVNLSSLARKQKEDGLTDAAVKTSLQF